MRKKGLKTSNTKERCVLTNSQREGVQRRHDPRKNDLRTSGFAELPPDSAKLPRYQSSVFPV